MRNLTMLADYYEFTMANGYFCQGIGDTVAYFDMFFRKVPDKGGFAIMAGVEQFVDYIKNIKFEESDIEYFRSKGCFSEGFLEYLRNFKFECDVWAIPEGTPIFPYEPIVTVHGPVVQAQIIETMLLLTINHQSLIATKANRMVRAAAGRPVMEFGSRRAQGADCAIYGARAAYIGGCCGTACTISDSGMGVPAKGTMAHSWVQMFPTEYDAFAAYASLYPDNCVFLVDTYNVLKSGVPNAIKAAENILKPLGKRMSGIRLDSGDISYLSKKAREMLDAAGFTDAKITASNSLDEFIICDLLNQGAKIDSFGIGERLITSKSESVFGGVYKLAAVEDADGKITPKIKISENIEKITIPHFKQVYRLFDKRTDKAFADLITLRDEKIDENAPYTLFDPNFTWKKKNVSSFRAVPLLEQIFKRGECVYKRRPLSEIQAFCAKQISLLWKEVLRFEHPHKYIVDLSKPLWDIRRELLGKYDNQ